MAGKYNEKVKGFARTALKKHGSKIKLIGGTVIDGTKSLGFNEAVDHIPSIYREAVVSTISNNLINFKNDWCIAIIVFHEMENGTGDMEMTELVLRDVCAPEIDSNLASHLDEMYLGSDESTRVSKGWVASPTLNDCMPKHLNRLEKVFQDNGCYDRGEVEKKVTEFNLKENTNAS